MSFISRQKQQAQATAPPQVSSAKQLGINYGGVPNGALGATNHNSIPKTHLIEPVGAVNTGAFQGGNQYQATFEFPKNLGKVTDVHAQVEVQFVNSDSDPLSAVRVLPTPFFIKRMEVLHNGQPKETIEAEDMFAESVIWQSDMDFALRRQWYNVSANGGLNATFSVGANTSVIRKWYIPLNANMFGTMQPFIKGFDGAWAFRLTFATDIVPSVLGNGNASNADANLTVLLNSIQLYVTEAVLSPAAEAAQLAAHKRGIVYKTVMRNKWISPAQSTISNTGASNLVLNGLTEDTAAVNFYLRDSNPTLEEASLIQHYPIASVSLKDSGNSQMTITLPSAIVALNTHQQVPIASAPYLNTPLNGSLFSFCSNLYSVLENGEYKGGIPFVGKEKLEFTPVSQLSNAVLCALAYEYAIVEVRNGVPDIRKGVPQ